MDGRKLVELYGKLERKSVQLKAEEQRAQQLERQNDSLQGVRTKLEMRVAQLEQLLFEKSACMLAADKTCRPRYCRHFQQSYMVKYEIRIGFDLFPIRGITQV